MIGTCDVAVIGAGIVGSACAFELASSGLRVAVVEPDAVGAAGTNLGFGSLSVLADSPGLFALTRYGLSLWEPLIERLPTECEYRCCGTILLAQDESQMKEAVLRCAFFNREGIHAEILDRQQLREAEPGLCSKLTGGLFVADDASLRASQAAEYLFQLALQSGAQVLRQRAVAILEHEVRLEDGALLYAGHIVNATGNAAHLLMPALELQFSKGHVLVVETQEGCLRRQVSEMTPPGELPPVCFQARPNGAELWIGSSHQNANETARTQIESPVVAQLLRRAITMLPAIAVARPLRSWTGFRSLTSDGLPLIGPLPIGRVTGHEAIWAACGHAGYGATVALATAKLIADAILLRPPQIDPAPYLPDRFQNATSKNAQ